MTENELEIKAAQSLKEYIDSRAEFDNGIYLDDDNADFVSKVLGFYIKHLDDENKMK